MKIQRFGRLETGTPLVKEFFGSNPWINFGVNNDFPQELNRLYLNSSEIHKSLIDRKARMIAGKGFEQKNLFVDNIYSNDNLNAVAYKCALDKVLFGGFYLNVIWNKAGTAIVQVEHLPYDKMRIAKHDCDEKQNRHQLEGFYFSRDWINWRRKENTPKFLSTFTPEPMFNADGTLMYPSQVMFFKDYTPGLDFYGLPSYNPALNAIKTDYEIGVYSLKNLQNGCLPGMIITHMSGQPTDEERYRNEMDMQMNFVGTEKSGGIIEVYANSAETAPTFTPYQPNNSDQRFKDLSERNDLKIMRAHGFTAAIAGIETAGKLGAASEVTEQLQYMQSYVIEPLQIEIEDAFNKIVRFNGSEELLTLNRFAIYSDQALQSSMEANSSIKKTISFKLGDK